MGYIYKTTNLSNGKIYVGKTIREDETYLGSGLKVVAAIEKYGRENFIREIIDECPEEELNEREIFWINTYNSVDDEVGYNISVGGTGGNHYWSSLSDEEKKLHNAKISSARKKQDNSISRSHAMSLKEGRDKFWKEKKCDKEWIMNRAKKKKKKYAIVLEDKTILRITGIKQFCAENPEYSSGGLVSISTGKKLTPAKGCYCFQDNGQDDEYFLAMVTECKIKYKEYRNSVSAKCSERNRIKNPNSKIRYFSKNGKVYKVENGLVQFHKKYGLSRDKAYQLINGKISEYQGWEYVGEEV